MRYEPIMTKAQLGLFFMTQTDMSILSPMIVSTVMIILMARGRGCLFSYFAGVWAAAMVLGAMYFYVRAFCYCDILNFNPVFIYDSTVACECGLFSGVLARKL